MKRIILILVAIMGFGITVSAQDVILKKDGSEIKTKVLEISDQQVKYKDFNFQNGPTRIINTSEIFMITYANGRKELFNTQTAQTTQSPPQQAQQPVQQQSTAQQVQQPVQQQSTAQQIQQPIQQESTIQTTQPADNKNLSANEFGNGGLLTVEGMKVFRSGVELSKFEVTNLMKNTNALSLYNSGLKKHQTGNILLWSGVGATAAGALLAIFGGSTSSYDNSYSSNGSWSESTNSTNVGAILGTAVGVVGIGVGITGIVLKGKAKNLVDQSVVNYNNRNQTSLVEFNFGFTSNGIGFVLTF